MRSCQPAEPLPDFQGNNNAKLADRGRCTCIGWSHAGVTGCVFPPPPPRASSSVHGRLACSNVWPRLLAPGPEHAPSAPCLRKPPAHASRQHRIRARAHCLSHALWFCPRTRSSAAAARGSAPGLKELALSSLACHSSAARASARTLPTLTVPALAAF